MELLITNLLIVACLLLIYVTTVFFFAQLLKDNSIMDICYGPAFFFASFFFLILTDTYDVLPVIITSCIGLWAMRLSSRILLKNFGKPKDARYANWRNQWMEKGRLYFLVRSYLQINLLQGLVILLVLLPFIISTTTGAFSIWFVLAGTLIFLFGLAYETIADFQLDRFIARKKAGTESATLMTKGLFKFSRRPNYFGETLIWWGQAVMVLSLPFGLLGLISPIVITYVVTKITGPMLEKIFLEKYPDEYKRYIDTTSYLIPWFPKQS